MCGLCGIIWDEPGALPAELGDRVLRTLAPRGPDDTGVLYLTDTFTHRAREPWDAAGLSAALLHRRLSIIDLSETASQPMVSPDGRYALAFNGEIYNYVELRDELEKLGVGTFKSGGDTEILLQGYCAWGTGVLDRLAGMFAFAVLDSAERRLFVARDHFGIKPLYYARWERGVAFASEIKALLELPGVSRTLDPQRVYEYLHHNVTDFGDRTMYRSVAQVPPGHYMVVDLAHARDLPAPRPYWQPQTGPSQAIGLEEAADRVRSLFLESVRLHMRSDVPVGAALSGGIDSSAIACAVRQVQPDVSLNAFSYVAADPQLSEERWIQIAADRADAHLHFVHSNPQELATDLEDLIRVQEEPFVSTSIYAQYGVFRSARAAGIKVMLSGQGADETFGGYKLFLAARLASLLRAGRLDQAARFLWSVRNHPLAGGALAQLAYALGMVLPERTSDRLMRAAGRQPSPRWLRGTWFDERGVQRSSHRWHARSREVLREMLIRGQTETSLPMLLRYEDRNSMAFSVESRVPFLYRPLVEFVHALPERYLVDDRGTTKAILRRAMRGIVPDAILDRTDKIAFATPERDWLIQLAPWVDQVLNSDTARALPLVDLAELKRIWNDVRLRRADADFRVLWRCLNLIRWIEVQEVSYS